MSKKFLVNWIDRDGTLDAETIECSSVKEAYSLFLEENVFRSVPVLVWNDFGTKAEKFDDHCKRITDQIKSEILDLAKTIQESGFNSLNLEQVDKLVETVDNVFLLNDKSEEELYLVRTAIADEQAHRFLSLRTSSRTSLQQQAMLEAMNVNLSDISKKTGGVKMASMFTGMAAARHMGEEIAEDMGGGDDSGGGWEE